MNTWLKYLIITLLFFLFAIVQNSFLPYFSIFASVPNLVFILFFILIFFEARHEYNFGFWVAIIAGFLLDVFLASHLGTSIVFLLIIYFLEKIIVHFLKERQDGFSIFYFMPLFLICLLFYDILWYAFSVVFALSISFTLDVTILFNLIYNTGIACLGFYIYKKFIKQSIQNNQLKLFR